MKYHDPLKKILSQARPYWDRDEMRPAVRRAFRKALQCRTAELGAEVYCFGEPGAHPLSHLQIASLPELWLPGQRTVATRAVGRTARRRFIRGSRSRCRMYFGPFSATTRALAKALPALAAKSYRHG